MTYPPDNHGDSARDTPIERDRRIINGSILALVAFVIVAMGIVWYALTDGRAHIAAFRQPAIERSVPNGTAGDPGAQPKAREQNQAAK
jgi:hypothetical protein